MPGHCRAHPQEAVPSRFHGLSLLQRQISARGCFQELLPSGQVVYGHVAQLGFQIAVSIVVDVLHATFKVRHENSPTVRFEC